jgi:DNA primase catalytic core
MREREMSKIRRGGIERERIEAIKRGVDLVTLVKAKGVRLRKNGRSYFGLCPFHGDKNPSFSVNPLNNLWQCFGCGAGGDVIRFIELFDQVDFKEAVNRLSDNGFKSIKRSAKKKQPPKQGGLSAKLLKLLKRVIDFYHTAFCEDPRARQYLNQRGITDNTLFSDFKIGFANGTLLNALPGEGDIYDQLKQLGVLSDKGHEHFYGYVTFPLYALDGNPAGLYGRRLDEMVTGNVADHLYLPGARHGLFNRQAAKAHKEIILTESIIDSLTLINAGIKSTVACYGTNGFTEEHRRLFKQYDVEAVSICFDADEAGKEAAASVSARLQAEGVRTHIINLPEGQDINDFFLLTANASDRFKELSMILQHAELDHAHPDTYQAIKKENKEPQITSTDYGFVMAIDGRRYEVRGLLRNDSKSQIRRQSGGLKATVKGILQEKAKRRLHVDTVDFYSARSRTYLIKGLCDLFGCDENTIGDDVQRLLELAEDYKKPEQGPETKEVMTGADKARALAFLKNPEMFNEVLSDFETIGYTGEEMNKLLCYIAAVSRKMEAPLSVMIQSRSAAGKSYLQDTVLSLVPEADFVKYTRLTDQALFYKDKDSLKHKILAIEELDGMNGAVYSIRSIQSSKKITIAYTGKDPVTGELKTQDNTVEGPLMVFITTTQVDIDGETASRFVFVSIDESEQMTKKILTKQRQSQTMEGMINKLKSAAITKKHRNANRLLKPLCVFNPYADLLTFTSKSLRARRDHTKYLNLILAIAYLFQYQRRTRAMDYGGKSIDYINVTLADIEKANRIANEVLGRSLDELTPPSRNLLKLIQEMVTARCRQKRIKAGEYHFTRRDIREFSGWSDFQVKTHIKQLEELEYVYAVLGRKGKQYVYELLVTEEISDDKPILVGLTDIKQLKKKAQKAGITDE